MRHRSGQVVYMNFRAHLRRKELMLRSGDAHPKKGLDGWSLAGT